MSIRSPLSSHHEMLLRSLVSKTLAYFGAHEVDHLDRVRTHLLTLLDAVQPLGRAQNLRSAYVFLQKQGPAFNQAFHTQLRKGLEAQLASLRDQGAEAKNTTGSGALFSDDMGGLAMTLIDVSEVERILLVDRITQKFTAHYDAALAPLTRRLGVLTGLESATLTDNPFRAEIYIQSFMSAWESCDFDNQATEDLMLSLEPQTYLDLAPLYQDLNATLTKAGIDGQTVYRIRKTEAGVSGLMPLSSPDRPEATSDVQGADQGRSRPAPIGASGGAQAAGGRMRTGSQGDAAAQADSRSMWGGMAPVGRSVAAHARQFLQRLGFGRAGGPARSQGMQSPASPAGGQAQYPSSQNGGLAPSSYLDSASVDRQGEHQSGFQGGAEVPADPEFMGYLAELQAGAQESYAEHAFAGDIPPEHFVLRQMRERDEVRRAPELDRGTVDALAEVFDYVFADHAIPLQMKFVIGRLQIPVLKAAMIDRDFFLSADHPARRLIDTLAQASIAWQPEKGESDPLYVRIENTVKRVLNEFEDDLDLFSELLLEFTEFLFETEQQAQGRIEPVADHAREGEVFEQALAHVDEVVHTRLSALTPDSPVLAFLAPFITQQWREVLAHAWMDVTDNPSHWEAMVGAMDQLIWSIEPKTTAQERRQLVAVLPELVRNINTGLDNINWVGDERGTFTRRLISTHMLAIRMTQAAGLDSQQQALDPSAGREAIVDLEQRRAAKLAQSRDSFDGLAQSLQRGTWFDFAAPGEPLHRCRLSWVSPMRTRLLFTNRDGFDAFVRSEREVAELLRQGQLRLLDQQPIVERALERIMAENESQVLQLDLEQAA
ncbi:DUF1631 family protein [Rhodoferax aquaticus]|nr:DUF1631 family protein [Rhodoferax aquaticus]